MKRLRIDYTIYSPNYVPGEGECWDYPNLRGAMKKAKKLRVGSVVIRNFNKERPFDWWQTSFCWVWNGCGFRKTCSLQEKKWVIEQSDRSQTALLELFQARRR